MIEFSRKGDIINFCYEVRRSKDNWVQNIKMKYVNAIIDPELENFTEGNKVEKTVNWIEYLDSKNEENDFK